MTGDRVEKLMSLTLREFQYTLAPIAASPLEQHATTVELPLVTGHVSIAYEARPSVRYGGLLDIPRALVTLTFQGVPPDDRTAFVKRFDLTFQRGGG